MSSYRYTLTRGWGEGPTLGFVMLNPSTANETADDPTIRKCMGFAKRNGFDAIRVCNLFAVRATDPRALQAIEDRNGDRDAQFHAWADTADAATVVLAWGRWGVVYAGEALYALTFFRARNRHVVHLGLTKGGQPRHPLMVPYSQPLVPWSEPRRAAGGEHG